MIFSDLDGTLLDHQAYSFELARPALNKLAGLKIPLILASSKTAMELTEIRRVMGFSHCPAIVENGAGILPSGNADIGDLDQSQYYKLLEIIAVAPKELGANFSGFANWSLAELRNHTGLSESNCKKAIARQFSEPGLWTGTVEGLMKYKYWLSEHGVSVQQGGRFTTLSFGFDKAQRMAQIVEGYKEVTSITQTLALGDAANDIGMLQAADHGVIVLNPETEELPVLEGEHSGTISRTQLPGPQGWNEAVLSYVERNLP
ncbi:MAG: HAD-IIB family hydrolase [Hyphomicrobiales bacterium]